MKLRKLLLSGGIAVGVLAGPMAGTALAHSADVASYCSVRSYVLTATDDNKNPKIETITGPVTGLFVGQPVANVDPVFTATGAFSIKVRWATTVGGSNYTGGNFDTVGDSGFDGGSCVGLQGPAGQNGTDGVDGQDGTDGVDGIDGQDGVDGVDGIDGTDGVDGQDGVDGIDGTNGTDGVDGADGMDGAPGLAGLDGSNGVDGAPGADGANGIDGQNGLDGATGPEGPAGPQGESGKDAVADYSFLTCDMLGGKDFAPPVELAHLDGDNDGIACESDTADDPVAEPAPEGVTPISELPHTGSNSTWTLLVAAAGLFAAGSILRYAVTKP